MNNIQEAVSGEVVARDYLISLGYEVVALNERCGKGELDIIAIDKGTVVFVEVKCRSTDKFGHPTEAVTPAKRKMVIQSAKLYINKRRWHERNIRFDVVSILRGEIEHVIDAFWIN